VYAIYSLESGAVIWDKSANQIVQSEYGKRPKRLRGLWLGLTDKKRWDVACKTVEHLKEHGDKWRLNEEVKPSPLDGAYSSPQSFTEAHQKVEQS